MELRFGEGGQDSKNFVLELFTAYLKYGTSLGFLFKILLNKDGHIMAEVSGVGVWNAFKNEIGQHCCQRVPVTENRGRKQTSIISVGVLPIREDVCEPLRENEMEITAQMCRLHSGGQNAQKNATAIRAIHRETNISVFIQNERSQAQNRKEAIKILTARVNDFRRAKYDKEYGEFRRTVLGDGCRGSKIRTYNFMQSRVSDHRLGKKTTQIDRVMRGEFGLILN